MARPIETVVECRQQLAALGATFEQVGWEMKIKSSFPRWRDRTQQRLAQFVSRKASTEFAGLARKRRAAQSEPWVDVIARHLAFLEALIDDIQAHPEEYGAAAIARERTIATAARERERTTPKKVSVTESTEVTLSWLAHHLSVRLVAFYVVSLLVAFAIGVRVSHVAPGKQMVGPPAGATTDSVRQRENAPR